MARIKMDETIAGCPVSGNGMHAIEWFGTPPMDWGAGPSKREGRTLRGYCWHCDATLDTRVGDKVTPPPVTQHWAFMAGYGAPEPKPVPANLPLDWDNSTPRWVISDEVSK